MRVMLAIFFACLCVSGSWPGAPTVSTVPILSIAEVGLHPVPVPSSSGELLARVRAPEENRIAMAGIDLPDATARVFVLCGLFGLGWALRRL